MPTTSVDSSAADSLVGVRDVSAKELVRLVCDTPTESLVRFVDLDLDEADEAVVSVLCGNADLTTTGIFVSGPASPALVDT